MSRSDPLDVEKQICTDCRVPMLISWRIVGQFSLPRYQQNCAGVQATPFIDLKFRKVCEDTVKGRGLQPDSGGVWIFVDLGYLK